MLGIKAHQITQNEHFDRFARNCYTSTLEISQKILFDWITGICLQYHVQDPVLDIAEILAHVRVKVIES